MAAESVRAMSPDAVTAAAASSNADIPAQLMFVHQGQSDVKEVRHWRSVMRINCAAETRTDVRLEHRYTGTSRFRAASCPHQQMESTCSNQLIGVDLARAGRHVSAIACADGDTAKQYIVYTGIYFITRRS